MRGITAWIVTYAAVQAVAAALLAMAGESRLGAYYSMAVLIHFIVTTVAPGLRERARLAPLDATLLAGFTVVVALRVYEVLRG